MAFELPDLPYAHDALEGKGMSKETLEFHHDIHHKAYVDNGNKAIAGTEWEGKSVEEIIKGTYDANSVAQNGIFNNASQYCNHNRKRREPALLRSNRASRLRCLGTLLLHRLPQQASGLPRQLPEQPRELGKRRLAHVTP